MIDLFYICAAALAAGFIDAVVGGGGLVQVPALFILFPHFPVSKIIGTNRFASFMGTAVAAYQYGQKVPIPWPTVLYAGAGAGVMSFAGATVSSYIRAEVLKPIILVLMLLIGGYSFFNKTLGQSENLRVLRVQIPIYGLIIGMTTGFYNGFVGPGTGSLLVFGFVSIVGFSFLMSSAVSKIINVIADVASLVFFLANDFVDFKIALPMMACNMIGSLVGSRMALLRGNSFVRTMFLAVIFGLILRFGYGILFGK